MKPKRCTSTAKVNGTSRRCGKAAGHVEEHRSHNVTWESAQAEPEAPRYSMWYPPPEWWKRRPFPEMDSFLDPTVTAEQIREAMNEVPSPLRVPSTAEEIEIQRTKDAWNLDGVSGALIDASDIEVDDDDYAKGIRTLTAQRDALRAQVAALQGGLHRVWAVIHNVVAHPLMVVLPRRWGTALHDWTAAMAFDKPV